MGTRAKLTTLSLLIMMMRTQPFPLPLLTGYFNETSESFDIFLGQLQLLFACTKSCAERYTLRYGEIL